MNEWMWIILLPQAHKESFIEKCDHGDPVVYKSIAQNNQTDISGVRWFCITDNE